MRNKRGSSDLRATHKAGLLILIFLGSLSWRLFHGVHDVHSSRISHAFFFFFFGITVRRKRNARLKQKINTNTFPGQTGTSQALHNLLSRTLTWKHNLPVTVDDVVKHSASLLLRISQLAAEAIAGTFVARQICRRRLPSLFGIYYLKSFSPQAAP